MIQLKYHNEKKKDSRYEEIINDLQNRVSTLVHENEKMSQILKRVHEKGDPWESNLKRSLQQHKK